MYYFEVLSNFTRDEITAVFFAFSYIFFVSGITDVFRFFIRCIFDKCIKVKNNEKKDS